MVIEARPRITGRMNELTPQAPPVTKITVFYCFNGLNIIHLSEYSDVEIETIALPCSSMNRETVLLRAFEAGADAVAVLVCPQGACRHLDGNLRAAKRVERTQKLLDEAGIDGRRLKLFNIPINDDAALSQTFDSILSDLAVLGPNPAR
jgi:F420-non-reducing hydrogenase iron-sulfur subunit